MHKAGLGTKKIRLEASDDETKVLEKLRCQMMVFRNFKMPVVLNYLTLIGCVHNTAVGKIVFLPLVVLFTIGIIGEH